MANTSSLALNKNDDILYILWTVTSGTSERVGLHEGGTAPEDVSEKIDSRDDRELYSCQGSWKECENGSISLSSSCL